MQILRDTYNSHYLHDEWEAIYRNDRDGQLNDAIMNRIVHHLQLPPSARVLDAGCGIGDHAIRLAKHGYRCVGIDISELILQRARARAAASGVESQLSFECHAMEELPFEPDSFDAIHCRGALMHIPNWEGALRNLIRVLKPGGHIVLLENNHASLYFRSATLAKGLQGKDVRRTQSGVEYWSTCEGLPFVARKADVKALGQTLAELGVRTTAIFATGIVEISHHLPGVVRNWVRSLNYFWFTHSLPWGPCANIAIVGEKK